MGGHFGTTGMWYKDGVFYELEDTHVNFFLNHYEILGFNIEEKEQLCRENGLAPDAPQCAEDNPARTVLVTEALKRGAIRIRFYRGSTTVQCYDKNDTHCYEQLQNCIIDGSNKCFGPSLTVKDINGWCEDLNSMGWGKQISDLTAGSKHQQNYKYIDSYAKKTRQSLFSASAKAQIP